jgi:hypothetical protein
VCVRACEREREREGACVSAQVHGAMIHQTVAKVCVYAVFASPKGGEGVRNQKWERECVCERVRERGAVSVHGEVFVCEREFAFKGAREGESLWAEQGCERVGVRYRFETHFVVQSRLHFSVIRNQSHFDSLSLFVPSLFRFIFVVNFYDFAMFLNLQSLAYNLSSHFRSVCFHRLHTMTNIYVYICFCIQVESPFEFHQRIDLTVFFLSLSSLFQPFFVAFT